MVSPIPSRPKRLNHRFRRTTFILLFCLGILAGLGLARLVVIPTEPYYWLLVPFVFFAFRSRGWRALCFVVLAGIIFGCWRGNVYLGHLAAYNELYDQKVVLIVTAKEDATYGVTKQLTFTAGNVRLEDGRKIVGKIQVSGFGENAVFQGDVLQIEGKFRTTRSAHQGKMTFAVMTTLERHPSIITEIRRKFAAGAYSAMPDPVAPFVMGILIGQRASLPEGVKDDLQLVGLTHIIAVSGYNLTIILQASRKLLSNQSKRIAMLLSVLLIGVFLLIAGASASIVRAAIVSMLSIAAGYYGRNFKPLNLLAMAAVITAWANPVYIWSDLSWYLSFLAFYGVMVLGPLIQERWKGKWRESVIAGVALESICAEITTLPFVLFIFGEMSHVSLLANVLVVSLMPLAMLLGAIAGFAGMFCASIAGWFSWPATILLNYMIDTAHILAGLPHNFTGGIGFGLPALLVCYGAVIALTAILMHKTKQSKPATITDRIEPKYRGIMS